MSALYQPGRLEAATETDDMSTTTITKNPATAPELLTDALHELERAEQVIKTALDLMSTAQKMRLADALEAAHIAGEGATRHHERRAVIERAAAALQVAEGRAAGQA